MGFLSVVSASVRRRSLPSRQQLKAALLPMALRLPLPLVNLLRPAWRRLEGVFPSGPLAREQDSSEEYEARIASELQIFAEQEVVHDLPDIFHYWSHRYLLPMQQAMGFEGPHDFFAKFLVESVRRARSGGALPRLLSIGAGNSESEVRIALRMRELGLRDFRLECLELNPAMRERGRQLAAEAGVSNCVIPVDGDFNRWRGESGSYAAIMANQSLHHVLELEHLFESIRDALAPGALFLTADVIGRNGHQRWPEARSVLDGFWQELPPSHRYNVQLRRQENTFLDWDCSVGNFEGIRAQDVLPLLRRYFQFELFLPWGNIVLPFIDRGFGPHFDADAEWDRNFIDRVHARDEAEMQAGRIKPTQLYAVMAVQATGPCVQRGHLSPEFCTREPD